MKSHESDLLELARQVYTDACAKCIADVSDLRDLETIRSRVEYEGLSFLTISLPQFCKDFERSLAFGKIDSQCFQGFRKYRAIPAFLRGMLSQIFDVETGSVLNDPQNRQEVSVLVGAVRQICRTFVKVELDCTPERESAAISGFVNTEHDLALFSVSEDLQSRFDQVVDFLWSPLIQTIRLDKIRPRHGPGATADKLSGNQKFKWLTWHERLEPYFPFYGFAYPISLCEFENDLREEVQIVSFVPPDMELPVKVTPVPKTMKGPRIIAVEPCCMQYAQQSIRSELYRMIESSVMIAGRVQFKDQSGNRRRALTASRTGQMATLDLSEASDRVPHGLSLRMFRANPALQDAIEACRSTHAVLPDGTVIGPLRKFASMGSALCFPVESMYFYTACIEILLRLHQLPVTLSNVKKFALEVFVYGDDLLVPSRHARAVIGHLQEYNCKVNIHKSFWTGKFRESCGMDAYDGMEVTPTYVRNLLPNDRRQASEVISSLETANLFYKKGYWRTAEFLYKRTEKILGSMPYLSDDSGGLGRVSMMPAWITHSWNMANAKLRKRWNHKLQRVEVHAWVASPISRADVIGDYAALSKALQSVRGFDPSVRVKQNHLEETERYRAVTLKRRWVAAL